MSDIQPNATKRVMRSIGWPVGVLCAALMIALGGTAFVFVRQVQIVSCLNATLQARNGPTLDFAHRLYLETKVGDHPTRAQRARLQRETATAIRRWYVQLRDNPLGRC